MWRSGGRLTFILISVAGGGEWLALGADCFIATQRAPSPLYIVYKVEWAQEPDWALSGRENSVVPEYLGCPAYKRAIQKVLALRTQFPFKQM
jgi:hypothetical protein